MVWRNEWSDQDSVASLAISGTAIFPHHPPFCVYCVRIDYSNVYNLQVILLKDVKVEKRCLPWVTVTEMSIA